MENRRSSMARKRRRFNGRFKEEAAELAGRGGHTDSFGEC
jgi:transposase-like protein